MEKKVIGYFSNWITLDDVKRKYEGYTDLLFSYWQDPNTGVLGAAEAAVVYPEIISFLKSKHRKCILSAGGEYLNPLDFDAIEFGTKLANFAITHKFDGVDLDIENIQMNSECIQWLSDVTLAVNDLCIQKNSHLQISHAPQAPFFNEYEGYAEVEKNTYGIIDYYNIQYYNQGSEDYSNYSSMFEEQYEGINNPTSILSIVEQGIPGEKLVVGKPITERDVNNTGYITQSELIEIIEQANNNQMPYGGIVGWTVDNDIDGSWGKAMAAAVDTVAADH